MINFFPPFLVLAASITLSFSPSQTIIPVGDEFKLTINLSTGGKETLGTDAVVIFDPKFVSATKIVPGRVYPNYPSNLQIIDNARGKVSLSGTVGLHSALTTDGVLGDIYFRPKKTGTTKISFDWKPGGTADSNIVPVLDGLDLLNEKPKEISLSFTEASLGEKIFILIKRIFSFDYLEI